MGLDATPPGDPNQLRRWRGPKPGELDHRILALLRKNRRGLKLAAADITDVVGGFSDLIEDAETAACRRVVILVDEYDKPILDFETFGCP